MPISRKEFEAGKSDVSLRLLEFLQMNELWAYSLEQLSALLAEGGPSLTQDELLEELRSLEQRGRVDSKIVAGRVYFVYRKVLGFRA
jgi:hypothetical protein